MTGSTTSTLVTSDNPVRSQASLAFEESWRGLRRNGNLIPTRADFSPAKFVRHLPNIIVIETPANANPRIRLVGTLLQLQIQRDIAGYDPTEFFAPELQRGVLESYRAMFKHPCGLWQRMPVHYARGFSQYYDVTALPLAAAENGVPQILCYVQFPQKTVSPTAVRDKAMIVETATEWDFIDVGNGKPAWLL